jgi:glycine cleavage system H protein
MKEMPMRYFSKDHEWVEVDGDTATVGITDYAQSQLGDIVFIELPEPGTAVRAGGDVAVVESVKAASDVYAPLSGTITAANQALAEDPSIVNSDAEGEGWFFRLTLSDPGELAALMDADAYDALIQTL